jgi:hypothetical protein
MYGVEVSPQESPQNPVPVEERGTLQAATGKFMLFRLVLMLIFGLCFKDTVLNRLL